MPVWRLVISMGSMRRWSQATLGTTTVLPACQAFSASGAVSTSCAVDRYNITTRAVANSALLESSAQAAHGGKLGLLDHIAGRQRGKIPEANQRANAADKVVADLNPIAVGSTQAGANGGIVYRPQDFYDRIESNWVLP